MNIAEASRFMRAIPQTFKTRAEGEDLFIEGYFSVFDTRYKIWDGYEETIEKGAFTDAIVNDDVRALINHDTTLVLGRNTSGTLTLKEDAIGLWGSIKINPKDQDALNAHARVERGDVNQCSFGFDIIDEDSEIKDGVFLSHIRKVKLYEVSICTFPAYEETSVEARDRASVEKRRDEFIAKANQTWKESMLSKLKGDQDA